MSTKRTSRVKAQFDQSYKGTPGIINDEGSMTVPDMSLSVKQLMDNIQRGIPSDTTVYDGKYFGDTEIPIITDLNDYGEIRANLEEQKNQLEIQMKADHDLAEQKRREDYDKRMKERQIEAETATEADKNPPTEKKKE